MRTIVSQMTHFKLLIILTIATLTGFKTFAQNDSTYYVTHNDLLHGRVYAIKKNATFSYDNKRDGYSLNYLPNTAPGIGIGVTYSWITVNVAYGLNFLNPDSKGKTRSLDLQIHGYGKKFILDTFEQFYKGFYLSPQGKGTAPGQYYYRPDLRMNLLGGSFQYVLNNKRFSFRSAFLQSDWQKKSSGSLLIGLEAYGGNIKADSSITPSKFLKDGTIRNETKNQFFEIGPTVGYAYTVVVKQHFFVTGSAAVGLDYGFNTMMASGIRTRENDFIVNPSYRIIAGYNAENWGISAHYINNGIRLAGDSEHRLNVNTGAYRINYVHRFTPGPKIKKLLRKI